MSVGTVSEELPGRPASAERPRFVANRSVVIVGSLTVLAAVLRFVGLGHQGFWFDEGYTVQLVHLSPGKMLGQIPSSESTPPLYYCVAWIWARVFGYGEAGLRSLSAVAGVATVPVAYGAARKLISERAGLIGAALTACNPFLIWYSQEARSYSLLVFLTGLALLAFAYAVADPTPRHLALWVVACGAALGTHYYAVLAVVPQAAWLLFAHRRIRPVQLAIAAVGVCGAALIPLALDQSSTGRSGWITKIALGPRLGQIIPHFLIGTGAPAYDVLEPLAAAMVVGSLVALALRADVDERDAAIKVGALAVGGLLLNLLFVAGGNDDLITRNLLALWLPAAIVVAAGLAAVRVGIAGLAAAAVLCATGVAAAIAVASDRTLERPDWRGVAQVLRRPPTTGSPRRAILVQHYRNLLPLSLYVPNLSFWTHSRSERINELDVVAISAPREHLCWWGAACNLSGTSLQSSYAIPGFRVAWVRHAQQFTIMRLVSPRPVTLTRTEIANALYATSLPKDGLIIQR